MVCDDSTPLTRISHSPNAWSPFQSTVYSTNRPNFYSAVQSLMSVLSASELSESSLQSQSSYSSPRNYHCSCELPFLCIASPSLLSEPIWYLKTTFSYSLQRFLMRLTLTIMKVSVNSRIVAVQRGNNNSRPPMIHNFPKAWLI